MSIINFVKAKKDNDMTVQAMRNINFADVFVSILALQTAMFREFSQGINTAFANALTGGGVCFLTIALGVFIQSPINKDSKLDRLRTLDNHVKSTAVCVALFFGICGSQIFGLGFAMVSEWNISIFGVIVSAIGVTAMAIAYPIYRNILKRNKNKCGEEILRLSEELLNECDKK